MSRTPELPSYSELTDALANINSNFNAAQIHGLFCGYISATTGRIDKNWEKIILGGKKNARCKELMQELYETSYHQLSEFSFEFTLLLPDDSIDINLRTEALGLWCQGFLTGLEQAGVPVINREESEVTEALNDIIEISQVSFGDIADNEEDETAYFELVEYVRLSAQMIFQAFRTGNPQNILDENDQLH